MIERLAHANIVGLLALTLGEDKAQITWTDAVRGLGIPIDDSYTREQTVAVLTALSGAPGPIGVAARLAGLRLGSNSESRLPQVGAVSSVGPPSGDASPSSSSNRRARSRTDPGVIPTDPAAPVDLLAFLVPSLGEEKAHEALQQYAKTLGVNASVLSREDAVALLEAMSRSSGLLGVVARFAKVRFLLRDPGGDGSS